MKRFCFPLIAIVGLASCDTGMQEKQVTADADLARCVAAAGIDGAFAVSTTLTESGDIRQTVKADEDVSPAQAAAANKCLGA